MFSIDGSHSRMNIEVGRGRIEPITISSPSMVPPAMTAGDDTSFRRRAPPFSTLPGGRRVGVVAMMTVCPTMLSASLSEPTSLVLMSEVIMTAPVDKMWVVAMRCVIGVKYQYKRKRDRTCWLNKNERNLSQLDF